MKKTRILMLTFLLLAMFALSSCGTASPANSLDDVPLTRDESTGDTASVTSDTAVPDFSSIMAGNSETETVWGLQDPAARQRIIDAAKADGFDVSFGADGSMTVKDKDGTIFVQKSDGTWTMQGEDGQSAQLGGDWPDNEFTRLVPKPDFKLAGASTSDDGFSAAFQSVNADQIKAYAEKVKANGFTVDAEEEDQNVYGVVVYTYSAYNADGYHVEVTFASGTGGITIGK
ncbi:MAG: hypothetical protein J6X30_04110 [Clostridia bacterium]|nr:hypothetical protein [Clostridia bacterium]